jgi:nucleotide-binding universal stress UspA family protein
VTRHSALGTQEAPVFDRIVVPLDGSELAEQALPAAEELARLSDAPLHLIRVVDLARLERYGAYGLAVEYAGFDMVATEERQVAEQYLAEMATKLGERGATVTTEIVDGPTTRVLVGATKPGDTLVMASHGRTGMSRWFLGSVAEEVVRHATVPVLLIRAKPAPDKGGAAPAPPQQ